MIFSFAFLGLSRFNRFNTRSLVASPENGRGPIFKDVFSYWKKNMADLQASPWKLRWNTSRVPWGWFLDTTEVLTASLPLKNAGKGRQRLPIRKVIYVPLWGGGVSFFVRSLELFLYTQWTSFLLAKTSSLPAQGKAVGGFDMRYITTRPKRWPQTSVGGTEFLLTCCKFVDFINSTEFFEFCTTED